MTSTPALSPASGVHVAGAGYEATTCEPWLRIAPDGAFGGGRVVELRYEAGQFDPVCRPLLRFVLRDRTIQDRLLPAASAGIGLWRGRVPRHASELLISPTNRTGPFSFRLQSVSIASLATRLGFARRAPKRAFFAASARLVGLTEEADLNAAWVYGQAETQDFLAWRAARAQALVDDVSPSYEDRNASPAVHVFVNAASAGLADIQATAGSLIAQSFRRWKLVVFDGAPPVTQWIEQNGDARIVAAAQPDLAPTSDTLVGLLSPGDRMAANALAIFTAFFRQNPGCRFAYCDEVHKGLDGKETPIFKPDWSPTRQRCAPYVGRAAFLRTGSAEAAAPVIVGSPEQAVTTVLQQLDGDAIGHIRRPLITTTRDVVARARPGAALSTERRGSSASVGIVIPTRDRLDLLRPCLRSVLDKTEHDDFRVVIADNGSAEPATLAWLAEIQQADRRVTVLDLPGPFNFAKICNEAARSLLNSELLLFLNNDTEVLTADWLEKLAHFACDPEIGAVGAKLLHADGTVQHAGVVLGMGGVAGHFGAGLSGDADGWLGSNHHPHEVSAVTGACLMVNAAKFWSIGGFDAEHLPVDLNDIDLCLRLGERGWRTICDCSTQLIHRESASRGSGAIRLQRVYSAERRYFVERWRHVIRDDPLFNPSLSLYARTPRLA